jgi:hypothetical protein
MTHVSASLPIIIDTSAMDPVLKRLRELHRLAEDGDVKAKHRLDSAMALAETGKSVLVEETIRRNGTMTVMLTVTPSAELLRRLGLREARHLHKVAP